MTGRTSDPRLWLAVIAGAVVVFAAYVSLVPFRFAMPDSPVSLAELFRQRVELGWFSRGNGLANLVMFVPFGFCATGALTGDRSTMLRWLLALVVVGCASLLVSVGIEALQVFVPGRTPSLVDVAAQTVGTGVGIVAWWVLGTETLKWLRRLSVGHRSTVRLALGIYSAVYGLYLVLPLDLTVDLGMLARRFRTGRIVINPLDSPALSPDFLPSVIADVVMAVPVGAFAFLVGTGAGRRRSWRQAFVLAAVCFVLGEIVQVFVQSRTADVVDLSAGLVGAAAGIAIAHALGNQAGEEPGGPGQPARRVLVAGFAFVTALYVVYNWTPFDFNFSPRFIAGRIGRFAAVPFAGYYQNAEFKALSDATIKLSLSVPFGVFLQLLVRPDRSPYRRALTLVVLVALAVFFSVVELGQVLLPSRYPDNTDVLLALLGAWAGMRFTRQFQSRSV